MKTEYTWNEWEKAWWSEKSQKRIKFWNRVFTILLFILVFLMGVLIGKVHGDEDYRKHWRITYYCSCAKCCGKWADGHFASGKKVYKGGVAVNWLPFGSLIKIGNKVYTVEDRGAKSIFGTKENPKLAVDIWVEDHEKARQLGVKYKKVEILYPKGVK